MGQGMDSPPSITISMQELEVVHDIVYLGSTISDTLSLDVELNKCIGKGATMFSRLTKKIGLNKKLTAYTKIRVYRACVLSSLLCCSESWTLCAWQERKLNTFYMCCFFGITWQDEVPNRVVLE